MVSIVVINIAGVLFYYLMGIFTNAVFLHKFL